MNLGRVSFADVKYEPASLCCWNYFLFLRPFLSLIGAQLVVSVFFIYWDYLGDCQSEYAHSDLALAFYSYYLRFGFLLYLMIGERRLSKKKFSSWKKWTV